MKNFYIETFGCQMNEFDSERISFMLEKEGYLKSLDVSASDIIIINTCAVREKAKNRLYGHLGNLKELKKSKKDLIICVGGCTAQSMRDEIQKDFPFVDIVFGTHNISELIRLIDEIKESGKNICCVREEGFDYDLSDFKQTFSFKAFLPISIGCNNFCSYCIVPYVRGREISINPKIIIESIKNLIERGVVEITLVGQNVNSYGKDLKSFISFPLLLEKISNISGLKRIRFMTSHPKDFSKELIEIISERSNICKHIHLPLQSGSDRILKLMNRKYSRQYFIETAELARQKINGCSLTTDIIVGFPGEQKEDFDLTLDTVSKVRFARAFTFIYSKRSGTKAADLEDNIDLKTKKEWFSLLLKTQNLISLEENLKLLGKNYEVLVEGLGQKKMLEGRLDNNIVVNFEGDESLIGKFKTVNITSAKSFYLEGKILK